MKRIEKGRSKTSTILPIFVHELPPVLTSSHMRHHQQHVIDSFH